MSRFMRGMAHYRLEGKERLVAHGHEIRLPQASSNQNSEHKREARLHGKLREGEIPHARPPGRGLTNLGLRVKVCSLSHSRE